MKAYLRVTAAGERARFQLQFTWFIIVAPLHADPVLILRAVEYPVELPTAKRPHRLLHLGPAASDRRLFVGNPLEHDRDLVPLHQPCTL